MAANGSLISPLLEMENPPGGDVGLEGVRYEVQSYINKCIANGNASDIAFYLLDLGQEKWVGINEEKNFAAASLLKIPLLIAILNEAQVMPEKLNEKIKYDSPVEIVPQNILPEKSLQVGQTYTVEELLRYMIVYSDNAAKMLIMENIDQGYLSRVYSDLGLSLPDLKEPDYTVSIKDFAVYFRVLYNATYLNKAMSEKALRLLTETEFFDGIIAGLPAGTIVAHKFGERGYPSGLRELHECGIVYLPKRPYLLGVMTKGNDFHALERIVRDISKIVYNHRAEKGMGMY